VEYNIDEEGYKSKYIYIYIYIYLPRNCQNNSVHVSNIGREQIRETGY